VITQAVRLVPPSMHPTNPAPPNDRLPFESFVRGRSWDWLLALRRQLNVDVQLVSGGHAPLLAGPAVTPVATDIDALLSSVPSLKSAVTTAMRGKTPRYTRIDRVQTICLPVTMGRTVVGALIVARRSATDMSVDDRSQLEETGSALRHAIEAYLVTPQTAQGDLDRFRSLGRVLRKPSARESDRDVVAAFAETMAVWHDWEVYGYVETDQGDFAQEVALAGANAGVSPALISRGLLPDVAEPATLANYDAERVGFATTNELVLAKIGNEAGSWLLVIHGSIDDELPRLRAYLATLEEAMSHVLEAAMARLSTTVAKSLLAEESELDQPVRQAVAQVEQLLGAPWAALTITTATGAPLVRVGSPLLTLVGSRSNGDQIVLVRPVAPQVTMVLAVGWPAGHRPTFHERRLVQTSADLLEAWTRRVVKKSDASGERRLLARSFEEILLQMARHTLESGVPVTTVVFSFRDPLFGAAEVQTRISRIREQVRPADIVGRLAAGEIGMLLYGTAAERARIVVDRVGHVLDTADDMWSPVPMSVGFASRSPGEPGAETLIKESRDMASRDDDDET
jgi:hypothetical protein